MGNTEPDNRSGTHCVALYIDANSRGEYYDLTGDKTMHKSLDYVCGFSRVSQSSRNMADEFSVTYVYQIKYAVVSAYSGAFFVNSDGVQVLFDYSA
jgi:hypothetical protein